MNNMEEIKTSSNGHDILCRVISVAEDENITVGGITTFFEEVAGKKRCISKMFRANSNCKKMEYKTVIRGENKNTKGVIKLMTQMSYYFPPMNETSKGSYSKVNTKDETDSKVVVNDDNLRECSLCLGLYDPDEWFVLSSDLCKHQFCINCLHQYVKIEIQEGRVDLKCPQCPNPMDPDDIEKLSVEGDDNSILQLYHHLMVQRVLVCDSDTRWCPAPDCTFGVIATGGSFCPKIDCEREGCGVSFCYHCRELWEDNHQCDKNGKLLSSNVPGEDMKLRECPRCSVFIGKMEDGSCNHMKCSVCGCEFCWLCMKEITDLHYLSPSGCTFWGRKSWSKKNKMFAQIGTLIGAPVGIPLLSLILIPAILIGFPVYLGQNLFKAWDKKNSPHKRNMIVISGVIASILVSPVVAVLAVLIAVPLMFIYTYVAVPVSLCRSCGGSKQ